MPLSPGNRILLVTDTWHPEINGVVKVIEHLQKEIESTGIAVEIMHPRQFYTVPLPVYPEFRLALFSRGSIRKRIEKGRYDEVHILTYGPLAWYARAACIKLNKRFTMSFHNQVHLYAEMRLGRWSRRLTERFLRWFYAPASLVLVTTPTAEAQLRDFGLDNVAVWRLGVEQRFFERGRSSHEYKRPVSAFLGRLALEKNVEEFLAADIPGTKIVIGDGPEREKLEKKYSHVVFLGYQTGDSLISHLSCADVLIMPSRTETFGIVILEALALGIPVAGHDVMGPRDIIVNGVNGYLDEDLAVAARRCLTIGGEACVESARKYSWSGSAQTFISLLNTARASAI